MSASFGHASAARRAWASSSVGDRAAVDDRVAPVVELDPLGEQLGAQPVAVAGDRVDAQVPLHAAALARARGSGSVGGAAQARHGPAPVVARARGANTRSALREEAHGAVGQVAGAAAGDVPAPALELPARAGQRAPAPDRGERSSAIAGRPCAHGPHWPALCSAS